MSEPQRTVKVAFHSDGSICDRAVTTRDCPKNHKWSELPVWSLADGGIQCN